MRQRQVCCSRYRYNTRRQKCWRLSKKYDYVSGSKFVRVFAHQKAVLHSNFLSDSDCSSIHFARNSTEINGHRRIFWSLSGVETWSRSLILNRGQKKVILIMCVPRTSITLVCTVCARKLWTLSSTQPWNFRCRARSFWEFECLHPLSRFKFDFTDHFPHDSAAILSALIHVSDSLAGNHSWRLFLWTLCSWSRFGWKRRLDW